MTESINNMIQLSRHYLVKLIPKSSHHSAPLYFRHTVTFNAPEYYWKCKTPISSFFSDRAFHVATLRCLNFSVMLRLSSLVDSKNTILGWQGLLLFVFSTPHSDFVILLPLGSIVSDMQSTEDFLEMLLYVMIHFACRGSLCPCILMFWLWGFSGCVSLSVFYLEALELHRNDKLFFIKFGKFSAIIFSDVFSNGFLPCPSETVCECWYL